MGLVVAMRLYDGRPERYQEWCSGVRRGALVKAHRLLAERCRGAPTVLDLGCGTGDVGVLCARGGAQVTGVDRDHEMAAFSLGRLVEEVGPKGRLFQASAFELDRLVGEEKFDRIVLSLMLSTCSEAEQDWILRSCERWLGTEGRLLVADEFISRSAWRRILGIARRRSWEALVFARKRGFELASCSWWKKLYYVAVELPLMVLSFAISRPLTHPLELQADGALSEGFVACGEWSFPGQLRVVEFRRRR